MDFGLLVPAWPSPPVAGIWAVNQQMGQCPSALKQGALSCHGAFLIKNQPPFFSAHNPLILENFANSPCCPEGSSAEGLVHFPPDPFCASANNPF